MKTAHVRKRVLHTSGALLPLALLACGEPDQIAGTDVAAPPAARIGNVATARLTSIGDGDVSGSATFSQLEEGLRVEISATGLRDGEFALALRDDEACAAFDAAASEASAAPADAADTYMSEVSGDLGSMNADASGMADVTREFPDRSLIGDPGVVSHSVVIYREDGAGSPAGDDEPVACGVIEWGTNSLAQNR